MSAPGEDEIRYLFRGDQATHVMLPLKQYERMLAREAWLEGKNELDDPSTDWFEARPVARAGFMSRPPAHPDRRTLRRNAPAHPVP